MANLKLVEILMRGTAVWNSWRERNPVEHVDFNRLTADGKPLAGANLARVFLIGARLRRADLRGADLRRAILRLADCAGANFRGADLANSDLFSADLCFADLREARLGGAFLKRTRLYDADLRYANGLTQQQIDEACGDETTQLPMGLQLPAGWRPGKDESRVSDDQDELVLRAGSGRRAG